MTDLIKAIISKFALPILAAACIGLGGLFTGVLRATAQLDARLAHVETQIERHEKALEKDFSRHEQLMSEIVHRTEDQEKRITLLEAISVQTQQHLSEIRSDVKILLRGGQQ